MVTLQADSDAVPGLGLPRPGAIRPAVGELDPLGEPKHYIDGPQHEDPASRLRIARDRIGGRIRATIGEGRRRRISGGEEVVEEPDRIREIEISAVIDIGGIDARGRGCGRKEVAEDEDRIREIDLAAGRVSSDEERPAGAAEDPRARGGAA